MLPQKNIRAAIDKFQKLVEAIPQVEFPIKHYFSKGVYAREMFLPKGHFCVGKIHKHENLMILSQGDVSIRSIEGSQRIKAPYTAVSPAGVKRVLYAHEDSILTVMHGTDETDLEKIEAEFIVKSYEELEEA